MSHLWNPYAKENIQNPYLMYEKMRQAAPVLKVQTGEWIVTGYDEVQDMLSNHAFRVGNRLDWMKQQLDYLRDDRVDFQSIVDAMNSFLVLLNDPHHSRIRSFISATWSNREVEGIIQENIRHLIDRFTGDVDLVRDFAMPLPVMTICKIMGIEKPDYARLKRLSEQMVQSLNLYTSLKELVAISEAAAAYLRFFRTHIAYRQANPGTDLVSKMIATSAAQEDPLTEDELVSICIFLFIAGEETTVNLIGNGMLALLEHRSIWNQLCGDSSLNAGAINELLRYEAPVQLVGRVAAKDFVVGEVTIPEGDTVTLAIGAANRDPEKFDRPDELDLARPFTQHLAFGRGKHFCLGSWLAKTQGELALKALAQEFPDMKRKTKPLKWNNHLALRGVRSLEIEI